ncbi:MAG: hypothetical protein EBZ48_11580 [Proteobacteria bacterium]|nr:hypothetical protein [Pseudomonadota bacterium]
MRAPVRWLLLVALLVLGIAVFGELLLSKEPGGEPKPSVGEVTKQPPLMVRVVVASREINTAGSFDPEHLSTEAFPTHLLPQGAVTSIDSLRGKVALGPIAARAIITEAVIGQPVAVLTDPPPFHPLPKAAASTLEKASAVEKRQTGLR